MRTLPRPRRSGSTTPVVAVILIALWLLALRVHNAYDPRLFGHGPEEYRAVATATVRLFATLAIISYLFKLELARGFLLVALPVRAGRALPLPVDLAALARRPARRGPALRRDDRRRRPRPPRRAHRRAAQRPRGRATRSSARAAPMAPSRSPACRSSVPSTRRPRSPSGSAPTSSRAPARGGSASEGLRRLGWELEGTGIGLVLGAGDDPGRRTADPHPAGGRPARCSTSRRRPSRARSGRSRRTFDVVGAAVHRARPQPAAAGRRACSSRGTAAGVLYKQTRVGQGGDAVPHVEVPLDGRRTPTQHRSLPTRNDGAGSAVQAEGRPADHPARPLSCAALSIDELPQLWNVLRGEMSLVGPRPPLASRGRASTSRTSTAGCWSSPASPASGRSAAAATSPWDDAVRLDLYYVENWNLVEDLKILWRTVLAVAKRQGAY